jgi:hypothetical protein
VPLPLCASKKLLTQKTKHNMRRFISILFGVIGFGGILYLLGPKPDAPTLKDYSFSLPDSLNALEAQINAEEKAVKGIREDNQARIIWADSLQKSQPMLRFCTFMVFRQVKKKVTLFIPIWQKSTMPICTSHVWLGMELIWVIAP